MKLGTRSAIVALTTLISLALLGSASVAFGAPNAWPMARHDAAQTSRSPYVGPSAPALQWQVESGGGLQGPPTIDASGTIYVGGGDRFYAVGADGAVEREFASGVAVPWLDEAGTFYASSAGGFSAIYPDDTVKWTSPVAVSSLPVIDASGTTYLDGGGLAIYSNGTQKWSHTWPAGGYVAVGSDQTAYASDGGTLVALNASGTVNWQWWAGSSAITLGQPVHDDSNGMTYVCGLDGGKVYAVDRNGHLTWAFTTNSTHVYVSPGLGPDGTLYVSASNSRLYALRPSGSLKWSVSTLPGRTQSWSSLAVDASGAVYGLLSDSVLGHGYRDVLAVNSAGKIEWRYAISETDLSSPVIGPGGTLYLVCWSVLDPHPWVGARLYAIGQASSGVSIGSNRSTVRIGQQAILSGSVTDTRTIGQVMDVQVKKPYKTHWSYSSNRRIYTSAGLALWQYKYTFIPGMTKGTYRFMARYGGLYSTSVAVTLR